MAERQEVEACGCPKAHPPDGLHQLQISPTSEEKRYGYGWVGATMVASMVAEAQHVQNRLELENGCGREWTEQKRGQSGTLVLRT